MTEHYRKTLFGPDVMAAQHAQDSHVYDEVYSTPPSPGPDRLTGHEVEFISARDSFYMATIGTNGWPYLQHRGGGIGFVRALTDSTLAFADFRGNRQYVSVGNLAADNRVSLFFMNYVDRARLKLLGRIRVVAPSDVPEVIASLTDPKQRARVEHVMLIDVEAFDWNCPQYIEPRYTTAHIAPAFNRMEARISGLEAELAALRNAHVTPT